MAQKGFHMSKSLNRLPQGPESWYLLVRQLNVAADEDEAIRPYLSLLFDLEIEEVLKLDVSEESPDAKKIGRMLADAMREPSPLMPNDPHRPEQIQFENAELAEALSKALSEIGVSAGQAAVPEILEELIVEMNQTLGRSVEPPPGLLAVEGVTPEQINQLFAVAAEFYRYEPWEDLNDEQPLAVHFSPPGRQGFVQLMGSAGMEFGLLLYWDWDHLVNLYKYDSDPLDKIPPGGWRSLTFQAADMVPPDDLLALQEYHWQVMGENAYPVPLIYTADIVMRPDRQELIFYEALLRALPEFIDQQLSYNEAEDDFRPVEAIITVETYDGPLTLTIQYPAGELPDVDLKDDDLDDLDFEADDELLVFDRRTVTPARDQDPALRQAQEIVDQAWEARQPSKRIRLARQALELSEDCVDAYVILAEEDAESVEEAYEYYLKGVRAGERTLGAEYFEENRGRFWGMVETRPYMRARQGLALCLADMGREEESQTHYYDMLSLNPDDNQGIRYMLLALLMEQSQDQAAEALLEQYADDGMAAWMYSRALLTFRKAGDTPQARTILQEALEMNPHVPAYLLGHRQVPEELPYYSGFGDESEAINYVVDHYGNWWSTRGAINWLREQNSQPKPEKISRKKASRGKRSSKSKKSGG